MPDVAASAFGGCIAAGGQCVYTARRWAERAGSVLAPHLTKISLFWTPLVCPDVSREVRLAAKLPGIFARGFAAFRGYPPCGCMAAALKRFERIRTTVNTAGLPRARRHAMAANPMVLLETSSGDILLELFADKAPKTVANFLEYVDSGFYANTIFHRVIAGFMIQGGGLGVRMNEKGTRAPVENEANNGLKNERGTLAMARTQDPHSATAQFFINLVDNGFLDHSAPNISGWGYCVFGKVAEGMDVVDKIAKLKTKSDGMYDDVPVDTVVITGASRFEESCLTQPLPLGRGLGPCKPPR